MNGNESAKMSALAASLLVAHLGMDELDTAQIAAEAAAAADAGGGAAVPSSTPPGAGAAKAGLEFQQQLANMDSLELEITLHILPSLLLFAGAGCGLGLVVYFFINLSDLTEDLINPYTLVERINSKLKLELAAHVVRRVDPYQRRRDLPEAMLDVAKVAARVRERAPLDDDLPARVRAEVQHFKHDTAEQATRHANERARERLGSAT